MLDILLGFILAPEELSVESRSSRECHLKHKPERDEHVFCPICGGPFQVKHHNHTEPYKKYKKAVEAG
jgi:hypothetical protein